MDEVQYAKTAIEKVHFDYLCGQFRLSREIHPDLQLDGISPDLFTVERDGSRPRFMLEMKSRIYPRNQKNRKRRRFFSDSAWWELHREQIMRYKKAGKSKGIGLFWIFLIGQTECPVSETPEISEDAVNHRDIYVVLWDAYKEVQPSKSGVRHMGLNRLKKKYDFDERAIEKGKLFIEESSCGLIGEYFADGIL